MSQQDGRGYASLRKSGAWLNRACTGPTLFLMRAFLQRKFRSSLRNFNDFVVRPRIWGRVTMTTESSKTVGAMTMSRTNFSGYVGQVYLVEWVLLHAV